MWMVQLKRYWNISTHQGHLFGCIALRNGAAVTGLASKNSKNTLSKTAWQPSWLESQSLLVLIVFVLPWLEVQLRSVSSLVFAMHINSRPRARR